MYFESLTLYYSLIIWPIKMERVLEMVVVGVMVVVVEVVTYLIRYRI